MMLQMPLTEVRIDGSGFNVRESLSQDFRVDHPIMPIHTVDQWQLIYDHLLEFDVVEGDLTGLLSYAKDPLMLLHYLLQRSPDSGFNVRACQATKYPV